ncbi:MAG TPA: urate hydroxylase PuuD [Thermoanaerobaculia bacterium]|jgi:uncharacterized membrane protein|nr:urate hydroxylase PuuD [Thermoanaerobaculia bacterium]
MNPDLNNWMQLVFRWGHVVAGVMWIGHLWFFNFVNGPFAGKMNADTKKLVVPELMPRALFWFRWGAAWTWITGILLLGLIYYQTKTVLFDQDHVGNPWLWLAVVLITLAIGFVIYNLVLKKVKNVTVASAINLVLFAIVYGALEYCGHYSGRALYIHAGGIFGTMMALNVWMVIWPYQQKIIKGIKGDQPAADAETVRQAGLRSRQNTYMSVPLIFFMISNHYPTVYGADPLVRDGSLAAVIILGFLLVRWMYAKSTAVQGF